jgi:hypothetical protein
MTKPKTAIGRSVAARDIDPRAIAADFFRKLGGMEGMTKWGRTHRSLAYQLIAKLLAQPLVQVQQTNVTINEEATRRKFEDALMRIIDARKAAVGDPACYVDGERLIEHSTAQPRDRISHTADPRPATIHDIETTIDDAGNDRLAYRQQAADRQRQASIARDAGCATGVVVDVPQTTVDVEAVVDAEPSTTAKYFGSSTRRDLWSNNG